LEVVLRRPRSRTLLILLLGALAGIAATWLVALLSGRTIVIQPRRGSPSVAALDFAAAAATDRLVNPPADRPVKNVILLIGDGMGTSHVLAARALSAGVAGRLFMERLPVSGTLTTYADDSIYTDSAAGATALATGHKTAPFLLSVTPARRRLTTVAEAAMKRGMAVGLVTDSYLLDATPAAFVAHTRRRLREVVAAQMASSGATILAGELLPGDEDLEKLLAPFRDGGYAVARSLDELRSATGSVAGLFPPTAIGDPAQPPELGELAAAALDKLSPSPAGFFLMVETEETDTGSHFNDFERVVRGVLTLDAIVERAVDFARRDGQTLVLVTADHETGGLMLLGGTPEEPLRYRWGTTNHTASPVPIFAYGPGAERFTGANDNTAVAPIVSALLGLGLFPGEDAPPPGD